MMGHYSILQATQSSPVMNSVSETSIFKIWAEPCGRTV